MSPLLRIDGLEVKYGGLIAVRGISLQVDSGSCVAVLGGNGAGKSSLLRAVAGLVRQTSGRVTFDNKLISPWQPSAIARAGLAFVPQGRGILAPLSVADNLLLGGYMLRNRSLLSQRVAAVEELFPILRERRRVAAGLLSGGEQQMLAIGRALISRPKMLLLDEPTLGLAPIMIQTVLDAIQEIQRQKIGILIVEQNVAVALEIADFVHIFEQGQIVGAGEPTELMRGELLERIFLGVAKQFIEIDTRIGIGHRQQEVDR